MESPALKAIISIICAKIISCENDARCKIKKSRNLFECLAVVLCKLEDMYENCHEEVYLVFFCSEYIALAHLPLDNGENILWTYLSVSKVLGNDYVAQNEN